MLEASDMKAIRRHSSKLSMSLDGSLPSISETESPTTSSGGTRLSLGTQNDSGISVDSSMNRGIRGGLRPCIVAEEPDDDDNIFGNIDMVQAQTQPLPEEDSNVYTKLHGSEVPLKFGHESPQKPSLADKSGLSASLPSSLSSSYPAGARHHREVDSLSLSVSGSCLKRANSENKKQIKRSISFSNLQVREYDLTIGDNPSVSYGPPVQLSWRYSESSRDLEEYENEKQLDRSRGRRSSRVENISWAKREALLKRQGFSQDDIDARMKEVNKVKQGRSVTRALVVTGRTEEALESAGRKLKRFFGGSSPESNDRRTIFPHRSFTNDSTIGDRASNSMKATTSYKQQSCKLQPR